MRILLTGVTGYIGKRLLPPLLDMGHEVVCVVRDKNRFDISPYEGKIHVYEGDFLDSDSLTELSDDIDIAFYLMHSMSSNIDDFEKMEVRCARNFQQRMDRTEVKQVIYLSGIIPEQGLSKHLNSRKRVEEILSNGKYHLTTLRSGIIVGSGSASFEIIRDLVEKLPLMVTPKWLNTKSQPIGIKNVIEFLMGVMDKEFTYDKSFDIGGPEILTYKEMLLQLAAVRKLKRLIITLPIMTPRLSSYWLYFVTATSYRLAVNLVNSMKIDMVCSKNDLAEKLQLNLQTYRLAVEAAFDKIGQEQVLSSWTDAVSNGQFSKSTQLMNVPQHGTLTDRRSKKVNSAQTTLNRIWSIGGSNGWYYGNWLWEIRGFLDKLAGGVGLRRGRKNPHHIETGESLDFWRVLLSSKNEGRLLLYAEMKLPGEAWLEFKLENEMLIQTATFRPRGLWGRVYWYTVFPFHEIIFRGMIKRLTR